MQFQRRILPLGTVYLSKSRCVYENLAFEEWLFRKHDFDKSGEALLLWSNTPSMVIGRYQNPFLEGNIKFCEENFITVARRFSGGGAVYHDLGNLNISFLTTQNQHNRARNLHLIADYLNKYFGVSHVIPNPRDDLIFESSGCKVSGTAARISHGRAYHHLTLLVRVSLSILKSTLKSSLRGKLKTNATRSTPAKSVGFLAQKDSCIQVEDVQNIVIDAFSSQYHEINLVEWTPCFNGDNYLQFKETYQQLRSEEWVYGRTPKFDLFVFGLSNDDMCRVHVDNGRIVESNHYDFGVGESFKQALLSSKFC